MVKLRPRKKSLTWPTITVEAAIWLAGLLLLCTPGLILSIVSGGAATTAARPCTGFPRPPFTQWCQGSQTWPLRDEHLIGKLPWAEGEEPIPRHYAGHIPIRTWSEPGSKGGETSMYYWFIPAINPKKANPPLIVWLQGGPGSSSMIGLFFEMGPLWVDADMKLHRRNHSWAEDYSMLFIDQPVGTGYSYVTHKNETNEMLRQKLTDLLEQEQEEESTKHQHLTLSTNNDGVPMQQDTMSISGLGGGQFIGAETSGHHGGVGPIYFYGYTKDQRGVADDLMVFLHEFYRRYPEQRASDLYITGESYAGKYVPTFADAIVRYNKDLEQEQPLQPMQQDGNRNRKEPIRLQGIALGNSLTDPVSQVQAHSNLAFYLGYLDWQQQEAMLQAQQDSVEAAMRFRFLDSNRHRNDVFKLFTAATGGINWYDVRKGLVPNNWTLMEQFMNLDMVKDSLNVYGPRISLLKQWACTDDEIQYVVDCRNEIRYEKDLLVREVMASDIMRTSAPTVGRLLDQGIKVLAYQGVFDYRDGVAGSHYWIDHLPWHGQEQFRQQPRKLWMLDHSADGHGSQHMAGYITQYDRLSKVAVLGAGHLAPMDQALSMQLLIRSFIDSETLHLKESHHEVSKHHTI